MDWKEFFQHHQKETHFSHPSQKNAFFFELLLIFFMQIWMHCIANEALSFLAFFVSLENTYLRIIHKGRGSRTHTNPVRGLGFWLISPHFLLCPSCLETNKRWWSNIIKWQKTPARPKPTSPCHPCVYDFITIPCIHIHSMLFMSHIYFVFPQSYF